MDINCLWHPTLMYHRWQGWNGQETFTEAPLLYEECSDEVGESLMAISDEVAAVCKKIRNTFPGVLLTISPVHDPAWNGFFAPTATSRGSIKVPSQP